MYIVTYKYSKIVKEVLQSCDFFRHLICSCVNRQKEQYFYLGTFSEN